MLTASALPQLGLWGTTAWSRFLTVILFRKTFCRQLGPGVAGMRLLVEVLRGKTGCILRMVCLEKQGRDFYWVLKASLFGGCKPVMFPHECSFLVNRVYQSVISIGLHCSYFQSSCRNLGRNGLYTFVYQYLTSPSIRLHKDVYTSEIGSLGISKQYKIK